MVLAAFDTLKLADRLGAGGFTPEQAHTAASAISDLLSTDVATKPDLAAVRLQLESKIETARLQLETKIETARLQLETKIVAVEGKIGEAKADIVKWVLGTIGVQTIAFILLKVFSH